MATYRWMEEYTEQRIDKYYIYVIDRYKRKWFLCVNGRFSKYQNKQKIFTTLYKVADTKRKLAKQNNIGIKKIETGSYYKTTRDPYREGREKERWETL